MNNTIAGSLRASNVGDAVIRRTPQIKHSNLNAGFNDNLPAYN